MSGVFDLPSPCLITCLGEVLLDFILPCDGVFVSTHNKHISSSGSGRASSFDGCYESSERLSMFGWSSEESSPEKRSRHEPQTVRRKYLLSLGDRLENSVGVQGRLVTAIGQ